MTDLARRLLERVRDFVFRPATAKYAAADSSAVVPDDVVRETLTRRIEVGQGTASVLADALLGGDIRVAEWRDNFAVELRRMNIEAFGLGRGGFDQITVADRAIIEARLKDEFLYLRQFSSEVANGNLTEAQIRARMDLYLQHVNATYWQGQHEAQKAAGNTQMRRVLNPAEHCSDCEDYASAGWVPIGELPVPGDGSQCQANCACSVEYQ